MVEEHPNISLMKRFDPLNLEAATDLFADDFVLHYVNPRLPDIQGDYQGPDGFIGDVDCEILTI